MGGPPARALPRPLRCGSPGPPPPAFAKKGRWPCLQEPLGKQQSPWRAGPSADSDKSSHSSTTRGGTPTHRAPVRNPTRRREGRRHRPKKSWQPQAAGPAPRRGRSCEPGSRATCPPCRRPPRGPASEVRMPQRPPQAARKRSRKQVPAQAPRRHSPANRLSRRGAAAAPGPPSACPNSGPPGRCPEPVPPGLRPGGHAHEREGSR